MKPGWQILSGIPRYALAVTAAMTCLTGCALEDVNRPVQTVPAAFPGSGAERTALLSWWRAFGSRELNTLMEQAAVANLDVRAALARIERAEAQARVVGAQRFPFVVASIDGSRSQTSGTTGSSINPPSRSNFVSGTLAASFELDIWSRNRDQLNAALAEETASRFDRDAILLSTQGAVVNAWLQLGAARDRLAIAQRNLANAERIRAAVQQRTVLGASTALELAQQDSLVASQRAALPPLRQSAETSVHNLAFLVGQAPQSAWVGQPTLGALRTPAVRPGLPSALLQRRPDIRLAEARLEAAEANVSAARKAMLPTISLTAAGGYQSSALVNLVRPESLVWSLGAGLVQTVFDAGRLQALSDVAVAERKELLEAYRRAIVASLLDTANALTAVRESEAREAAQRTVITKTREAFRIAEQRLKEGAIDLQTLLSTQAALFQAEDILVQDRLARLQAAVSLIIALGGDVSCAGGAVPC